MSLLFKNIEKQQRMGIDQMLCFRDANHPCLQSVRLSSLSAAKPDVWFWWKL